MSEQRRRQERHALIHHLPVRNRKTRELLGYLGNLTTEGMLLYSNTPVSTTTQSLVPCSIMLPEEIDGNDHVVFQAKPVWSRLDDHRRLYSTGMHIRRIRQKDIRLIRATIERYRSRSGSDSPAAGASR